jgi:hypothetical protein
MNAADKYIDRVVHLPPAPTVVVPLLELFDDPDRDLDRFIELISHDPSLTAEVLSLSGTVARLTPRKKVPAWQCPPIQAGNCSFSKASVYVLLLAPNTATNTCAAETLPSCAL